MRVDALSWRAGPSAGMLVVGGCTGLSAGMLVLGGCTGPGCWSQCWGAGRRWMHWPGVLVPVLGCWSREDALAWGAGLGRMCWSRYWFQCWGAGPEMMRWSWYWSRCWGAGPREGAPATAVGCSPRVLTGRMLWPLAVGARGAGASCRPHRCRCAWKVPRRQCDPWPCDTRRPFAWVVAARVSHTRRRRCRGQGRKPCHHAANRPRARARACGVPAPRPRSGVSARAWRCQGPPHMPSRGEGEVLRSQSARCKAPEYFPRARALHPSRMIFGGGRTALGQWASSDGSKGHVPSFCERVKTTAGGTRTPRTCRSSLREGGQAPSWWRQLGPPVIWGSPPPGQGLGAPRDPAPPGAMSGDGKLLGGLGLVFLFLPRLAEPDVASPTVWLGGGCLGCPPPPRSPMRARLSVRPSPSGSMRWAGGAAAACQRRFPLRRGADGGSGNGTTRSRSPPTPRRRRRRAGRAPAAAHWRN